MDLDATAALHAPHPELLDPADRALFIGRRLLGWLVDSFIVSTVMFMLSLGMMLVVTLLVGVTIGAAGGGLEGLIAGGVAGIFATALLVLVMNVVTIGTLLAYYAWAARRTGAEAGQTLGHQLVGVRVVMARDPSERVRGRRLLGRELARYLWMFGFCIPAFAASVVTESSAVGQLLLVGTIGLVLWTSSAHRFPHDRMAGTRVIEVEKS